VAFVYKDNEAYKEFIKLYCGSQRKDRKAWTDYFISVMFLEVCRKKEFTELLLEEVIYTICLSIGDNYDVEEVSFTVEDKENKVKFLARFS